MLQWKYLIWWHTSQLIPQGKNYNSGLWTVVSARASAVIRSQGHLDPESRFTKVVPFQTDGVLDLLPTLAKPWVTLHITKQSGHFTVEGPSNLVSAPQINLTRRDSACRDILLLWSHHFYLQPQLHLWFTSRYLSSILTQDPHDNFFQTLSINIPRNHWPYSTCSPSQIWMPLGQSSLFHHLPGFLM